MLHILLLILKIIGILIAVVLGLLLVVVLIVLFVPIRYRLEAKKYSGIEVRGKATWLFGLVHLKIFYLQEKLSIVLRICGYRYFDNNDTREKKHKKNDNASKKKKESKQEDELKQNDSKQMDSKQMDSKQKSPKQEEIKSDGNKKEEVVKSLDSSNGEELKRLTESKEKENLSTESEQTKIVIETERTTESEQTKKVIETERTTESDKQEEPSESDESSLKDPPKEKVSKRKRLFSKWKSFVLKIKNIVLSIFLKIKNLKNLVGKMKEKLRSIWKIILNLWDKKRKVVAFFQLEENKAGIKVGLVHLWEILRHIGPTKTEGYIRFGTGDPASTGQALGIAAALYGYYGKYLTIEPDFEQEILEGEVLMKGRIRLFNLLIIGIKLLREEKLKRFIKNAKRLKEELL